MVAHKTYEDSWYIFVYLLQATKFPIKYTKNINVLCVVKILWCSGDIWVIQAGKCDQLTQFLKPHGVK